MSPIILEGDEMLELSPQAGQGFTYDCFADQETYEGPELNLSLSDFVGDYERQPVMNGYHEVTIELIEDQLYWRNASGVQWQLLWRDGELWTGDDCPYGAQEIGVDSSNLGDELSIDALVFLQERYIRTTQE